MGDAPTKSDSGIAIRAVQETEQEMAAAAAPPLSPSSRLAADRQELLDLICSLQPADAFVAYRFLAYLRSVPQEKNLRVYGDGGQAATLPPQSLQPVVVLVGPCEGIAAIEELIRDIDGAPHLEVNFRLFRDGFYRVDGQTDDRGMLGEWLAAMDGVQSVADYESALHVLPASGGAP